MRPNNNRPSPSGIRPAPQRPGQRPVSPRPNPRPVGPGTGAVKSSIMGGFDPVDPVPSKFNFILLPFSLLLGAGAWYLDVYLYDLLRDRVPYFVLIALIFTSFTLILIVGLMVFSLICGAFQIYLSPHSTNPFGIFLFSLLLTLVVLIGSGLLQLLYSADFVKGASKPTSYVFLIDDSSSNKNSDPNELRYQAIFDVLEEKADSFPYMIYGFSTDTYILRDMAPISEGTPELTLSTKGSTNLKAALKQIIDDYNSGIWDGGDRPNVILVTDGKATDAGRVDVMTSILEEYSSAGISISCIGLGDADADFLQTVADQTGGISVSVSDATELIDAMHTAAFHVTTRDLLSTRTDTDISVVYAVLRVVFLTLIGFCIAWIKSIAYANRGSFKKIPLFGTIQCLIGALALELGTSIFGLSDRTMWLVLWLCIALTIGFKPDLAARPAPGPASYPGGSQTPSSRASTTPRRPY